MEQKTKPKFKGLRQVKHVIGNTLHKVFNLKIKKFEIESCANGLHKCIWVNDVLIGYFSCVNGELKLCDYLIHKAGIAMNCYGSDYIEGKSAKFKYGKRYRILK